MAFDTVRQCQAGSRRLTWLQGRVVIVILFIVIVIVSFFVVVLLTSTVCVCLRCLLSSLLGGVYHLLWFSLV